MQVSDDGVTMCELIAWHLLYDNCPHTCSDPAVTLQQLTLLSWQGKFPCICHEHLMHIASYQRVAASLGTLPVHSFTYQQ